MQLVSGTKYLYIELPENNYKIRQIALDSGVQAVISFGFDPSTYLLCIFMSETAAIDVITDCGVVPGPLSLAWFQEKRRVELGLWQAALG